jgi:hypothetical protein
MTGPARCAMDMGRRFGFEDGVVAADAALRLGATRADLWRVLARMGCWPHVTQARAAALVADGGAQSIGETLTRLLVLELGRGMPQTQYVLTEGERRAEVDLRLGRLLIEFDGRVKYVGRERGGLADRPPEEVLWAEKRREDWLRGLDSGYLVSRVVWPDLLGRARRATWQRLDRAFQDADRLFGHLDDDPPRPVPFLGLGQPPSRAS